MTQLNARRFSLSQLDKLWNRDLPPQVRITLQVGWPLILLPVALLNQLFTPHVVWVVLIVSLVGLYALALLWVRHQSLLVDLTRTRDGQLLVAGDRVLERFEIHNESILPLLWAEFVDESNLPNYHASQVVACAANGSYSWRNTVECKRRGVYRLGPFHLAWGDPFGLFRVEHHFAAQETIVIYPRVAHLPDAQLPHGNTNGVDRRRRRRLGNSRATTVREYQPGDSLRYIHWPITAHRNALMVTELETEPSGDAWIILDLNGANHQGEDEASTLEFAIVIAASIAAELLNSAERQAVGLITTTGRSPGQAPLMLDGISSPLDGMATHQTDHGDSDQTIVLAPQPGQAQLWRMLTALAPVEASQISLDRLLQNSLDILGRGRVLIVITPEMAARPEHAPPSLTAGEGETSKANEASTIPSDNDRLATDSPTDVSAIHAESPAAWVAELVHIQSRGINSSVMGIAPARSAVPASTAQPTADRAGVIAQPSATDAAVENTNDEPAAVVDGASAAADDDYERLRSLLARHDMPVQVLPVGTPLRPALTYRRTRTVIRSTPTGGAVTMEVEEEVG